MEAEAGIVGAEPQPESNSRLYPIFLSLRGKTCVVIGGGRVASRKIHLLLTTGARILVVSPLLHEELQRLLAAGSIQVISGCYAEEYLSGAALVFAATDSSAVNQQVARDARQRGIWVNRADEPDDGDFFVPATIRRQNLTVAISTAGSAPAFARYMRELLEQTLDEALGQALELIAQARSRILEAAETEQRQLWESLFALHLEQVIRTEGHEEAKSRLEEWMRHS